MLKQVCPPPHWPGRRKCAGGVFEARPLVSLLLHELGFLNLDHLDTLAKTIAKVKARHDVFQCQDSRETYISMLFAKRRKMYEKSITIRDLISDENHQDDPQSVLVIDLACLDEDGDVLHEIVEYKVAKWEGEIVMRP